MKTKRLVISSLFAAIIFLATVILKLPSFVGGGYINLGDSVILLSAFLLDPLASGLAAGIGSFIADLVVGASIYAVPTFIIKFLMGFVVGNIFKKMSSTKINLPRIIICGIIGEAIMIFGYFLYEIFLYGIITALTSSLLGLIQAITSILVATILYFKFIKNKSLMRK